MEKHKKKSAGSSGGKSARSATVRDLEVADRDQEKIKAGAKYGGDRKDPIKY
jgi:hypothetical protein